MTAVAALNLAAIIAIICMSLLCVRCAYTSGMVGFLLSKMSRCLLYRFCLIPTM